MHPAGLRQPEIKSLTVDHHICNQVSLTGIRAAFLDNLLAWSSSTEYNLDLNVID